MKLEYESTLDELIETQMIWLRDINTVTKWRIWGGFYWILIATFIIYFATGPIINKIIVGLVIGGFVGGNLLFNAENALKRKMRRMLLKKGVSAEPSPSVITLSENNIELTSRGATISFPIKDMSKIEELINGLVLNFSKTNLLYIPFSAFSSNSEKEEWISKLNSIIISNA